MKSINGKRSTKGWKELPLKLIVFIVIFAVLTPMCFAHIPLTGEGYGLSGALVIKDPLKLCVIYREYKPFFEVRNE